LKIESARIFLLRLPLSQPYNHHGVSRRYTDNVVVRLRSDGLEGYGEGVPRIYVTGESADSAFEILRQRVRDCLARTSFSAVEEVRRYLSRMSVSPFWQSNLAAFCAFELALLDLSSKYWDQPLETIFRTRWNQPPLYSAVIPLLPPERMEAFLTLLQKNDMRIIKIKVGADVDRAVFERTLSVLGTDVDLRVDANGAWMEREALKNIELMKTYGVGAVEQPVAKGNLKGLKAVTSLSKTRIIADESVCSLEDARNLLNLGACHAFNVRLSKCGGFFGSLAVLEMARRGGLRCQIGCQVGETGILSAAGRHLAGWVDDLLYLEGSFGTWALEEDIVEEDIRFGRGGQAPPLKGSGLGVRVSQEALERHSRESETVIF